MIKEIIHELIYLTKQDPGMREYDQVNRIIITLIIIICAAMIGYAGISMWV